MFYLFLRSLFITYWRRGLEENQYWFCESVNMLFEKKCEQERFPPHLSICSLVSTDVLRGSRLRSILRQTLQKNGSNRKLNHAGVRAVTAHLFSLRRTKTAFRTAQKAPDFVKPFIGV